MPVSLPYSWEQSQHTVTVTVQLKHADRRRPETQITRVHVQLNSPPLLLVLDLIGEVQPAASSVRLGPDQVTFVLRKVSRVAAES